MDEPEEIQRYEIVSELPDEVGKEDQERKGSTAPQPLAEKRAQTNHRRAKKRHRHSREEGSNRRVYHVPPAEEPSVVDRGQLVAVESVLAVGRGVQRDQRHCR